MKPEFAKYLSADSIVVLAGTTKKEILEEIVAFAAPKSPIDRNQMEDAVWKRERMMTTGVGMGLALPHIRVNGFGAPLVVVGICEKPVKDYKSIDNVPVRVAVFIAATEGEQDAYLKLLGSVSAKFKNADTIAKLIELKDDPAKVHKFLSRA